MDCLTVTAQWLRDQASDLTATLARLEADFCADPRQSDELGDLIRETDAALVGLLDTILDSRRLCGERGACSCAVDRPAPPTSPDDCGEPLFGPNGEEPILDPDGNLIDSDQ
jgi:hypothetical protein